LAAGGNQQIDRCWYIATSPPSFVGYFDTGMTFTVFVDPAWFDLFYNLKQQTAFGT
jgi:hypothetical protein